MGYVFSLADVQSQLPIVYRKLVPQVQRKAPFIRLLSQMNRVNRNLTLDKMRWTVRFGGQTAGKVNADGGAFIQPAADVRQPAALAFGSYDSPAEVTDEARRLVQASAGVPAEMNPFDMLVQQSVSEAAETLLKLLEQEAFGGDGTNKGMLGLGSEVTNSGIYADINSATYTDWKSYVSGNGGVLRDLTLAMIKTATATIGQSSAMGRPDLIPLSPALFNTVEGLFDAYTRVLFTPQGGAVMPGTPERMTANPASIALAGGQIKADGFRIMYWQSQNIYFVEVPDCQDATATNTTSVLYLLNSNDIELMYPPPVNDQGQYVTPTTNIVPNEQGMGPLDLLPFEMNYRGRTRHANTWDITCWAGIKIESRNAHGKIQDIR